MTAKSPLLCTLVRMRARPLLLLGALLLCAAAVIWLGVWLHRGAHSTLTSKPPAPTSATPAASSGTNAGPTTQVYAHNLLLHKGPDFQIFIPWVRGEMVPNKPGVVPSFDDMSSFYFDIHRGVIHVRLQDLSRFLNAGLVRNMPLTHIELKASGTQLQMSGTLRKKLVPLPVQLTGSLSVTPKGLVRFHIEHVSVLKMPMKGLLGALHVSASDLVSSGAKGIQIDGNDVVFDTELLLPPPHVRGELTSVAIITDLKQPALEAVYGNARNDRDVERRWRNFLHLTDGTLRFGKLTMQNADMIMIDATDNQWFDLDLANYQAQLTNGISYTTPQEGLEIYMPSLDALPKRNRSGRTVNREWLKNRNLPMPPNLLP